MILYIENPKVSIQKLLALINEFGKTTGYKINIQKSVAFIYTNNEISESFKKIPFKNIIKRIVKYLAINLTKEAKTYKLKTIKH